MHGQRRAVPCAPQYETDRRAVPQPADQHRQEQVQVGAGFSLAVAAQRNVKVIFQPARQRNVPPAPEFGDRSRFIRRVEVLREAETQQQRQSDRHVRIAREVAVDLQGVAVYAHQILEPAV